MKTTRVVLVPLLLVVFAQAADNLKSELKRLHVHTALLVHSQAVDEFPVWSPDSRYLGVNIQGRWFKLDLSKVYLSEATWHGDRLGAVRNDKDLEPITEKAALEWAKATKHGSTYVTGKSGLRAEFEDNVNELSTFLVLSRGTQRTVVFKSDIESCGEPTFSPNEEYLAYICETNGVLVTDPTQVVSTPKSDD
jgi:hypothetical protein